MKVSLIDLNAVCPQAFADLLERNILNNNTDSIRRGSALDPRNTGDLTDGTGSRQEIDVLFDIERVMLRCRDRFARISEDCGICLTNNAAERALRGLALGRQS
ncbi:MAG: hypothetical protein AAGA21_23100 [Pseudomonadota bacterium]